MQTNRKQRKRQSYRKRERGEREEEKYETKPLEQCFSTSAALRYVDFWKAGHFPWFCVLLI